MVLQIKLFATQAEGKDAAGIEDKISINEKKTRFAVADGVSASYFPHIWAEILTKGFVNSNALPEDYYNYLNQGALIKMQHEWECYTNEIESKIEGPSLRRLNRIKKQYGRGASTLAGIFIDNDVMHYFVLGDSCIFLINSGGMKVLSSISQKDSFDNYPDYIPSVGAIHGKPVTGFTKISKGWIVISTDAMSEWLWHMQEEDETTITRLWEIETLEDFNNFIIKERNSRRLKNDDIALLMIKINESISEKNENGEELSLNNVKEPFILRLCHIIVLTIKKWLCYEQS